MAVVALEKHQLALSTTSDNVKLKEKHYKYLKVEQRCLPETLYAVLT